MVDLSNGLERNRNDGISLEDSTGERELCPGDLPHVGDGRELLSLVERLSVQHDEVAYSRALSILDAYQEQGELLDGILPTLVPTLMVGARRVLMNGQDGMLGGEGEGVKMWRVVYFVMKVRGWKVVSRLMGCEVGELIQLVDFICQRANDMNTWGWEVVFGVWIWLSGLILVPFGLRNVLGMGKVDTIADAAMKGLGRAGRPKEGAAVFLSRILTRPDMQSRLKTFVFEAKNNVRHDRKRRSGALRTLVWIYKTGRRSDIQRFVPVLLPLVTDLLAAGETKVRINEEEKWLTVKLLSRLALSRLPPKLAPWRYSRGSRLLFCPSNVAERAPFQSQGIGYTGEGTEKPELSHKCHHILESQKLNGQEFHEDNDNDDDSDGFTENDWLEDDVQEMIEAVVEILLTHMQDPSTKIRWATAKAFGRITSRLPRELAADIVNAIFDALLDTSLIRSHASWHGGLLTLAELARHGTILPEDKQLDLFVEFAVRASKFDVRVREHSVGANVRDSACYAFWAMARAYASDIVAPFAVRIAESLLPLALLDREVSCRRAAAAAYQECVGRTETFAHGISIIGIVNFFSVNNRSRCYGFLLYKIAMIGNGMFRPVLMAELRDRKVNHWDIAIRELAAEALARISCQDLERRALANLMLKRALQKYCDPVIRHGAVLALAYLIKRYEMVETIQNEVRRLLATMQTDQYFHRNGGDIMRCAACYLISASALSGLYKSRLPDAQSAFSLLAWTLSVGDEKARAAACEAIATLCEHVIKVDVKWANALCERFSSAVLDSKSQVEQRRGYAATCGALGNDIADGRIVQSLIVALIQDQDVEVRRNAASSLGVLVSDKKRDKKIVLRSLRALCKSMQDWHVDNRGDVGSWVRKESLIAARKIVTVEGRTFDAVDEIRVLQYMLHIMVRLCHERIDSVRSIACESLLEVVKTGNLSQNTKSELHCDKVLHVFEHTDSTTKVGTIQEERCARLFPALHLTEYWSSAFVGLCSSAGGLGYQSKESMEAVLDFLRSTSGDIQLKPLNHILHVLGKEERMALPLYRVLERAYLCGCFESMTDDLGIKVVHCIKSNWVGVRRDVSRLGAAGSVLCGLAARRSQWPRTRKEALTALGILLCGPIPRVRRIAAEGLYLLLIGDDDTEYVEDESRLRSFSNNKEAIKLVLHTKWQFTPARDLKDVRSRLWELLDVT